MELDLSTNDSSGGSRIYYVNGAHASGPAQQVVSVTLFWQWLNSFTVSLRGPTRQAKFSVQKTACGLWNTVVISLGPVTPHNTLQRNQNLLQLLPSSIYI